MLKESLDDRWSNVLSYALPDGAHNREKDLIYFHIPAFDEQNNAQRTLFGVAAYRQIDASVSSASDSRRIRTNLLCLERDEQRSRCDAKFHSEECVSSHATGKRVVRIDE